MASHAALAPGGVLTTVEQEQDTMAALAVSQPRAAIYVRVSDPKQEAGYSLPTQEERCRAYAAEPATRWPRSTARRTAAPTYGSAPS